MRIWILATQVVLPPLAVIIFRKVAIHHGVRPQLDSAIHFLGGFAITYTVYVLLGCFRRILGLTVGATHFLLAFTIGCTVALFWEFGELANDYINQTRIQYSARETLWDLINGTLGAILILILIAARIVLRRLFRSHH